MPTVNYGKVRPPNMAQLAVSGDNLQFGDEQKV
jgi:hypothetical protein